MSGNRGDFLGRGPRFGQAAHDRFAIGAGPASAKEVKSEASDAGISWPSVRRAVEKLGVKSRRTGGAAGKGHWYWELPGRPTEGSAPDALSLIGVVNE
jgi:hypothetical protein